MNDRRKLSNGWTVGFTRQWMRGCRWAQAYCLKMFHRPWHDDRIARGYMAARNGYIAGYKAGHRAATMGKLL